MTSPFIAIHQYADNAVAAFVHLEGKVRSIFATSVPDLERHLTNVGIAEFGLDQESAAAAAKGAISGTTAPAPEPPVDLAPKVADLETQLTAMLQRALKAEADVALANSEIATLKANIEALHANTEQPGNIQNTPPPTDGGSVQTPAGGTPPADASPPQPSETGAAPNTAATGGEQGANAPAPGAA